MERFQKPLFTLLEWRSDKFHNGTYALSNMLPDLEYRFRANDVECRFAVECKWRSSFVKGEIQWAKQYQLDNYIKFAYEKRTPVFVIIGIGGTPDNPQSLYIIPLTNINSIFLDRRELQKYYRPGKGNFFFNAERCLLK